MYESLETVTLALQTPTKVDPIFVEMDVVTANVPAFLGLDEMDENALTPGIVTNMLVRRIFKNGKFTNLWHIKLIRAESNHLFAPLKISKVTRFTRVQLNKFHKQLFHPKPDKLFNLIKKARPEHALPETRKVLQ